MKEEKNKNIELIDEADEKQKGEDAKIKENEKIKKIEQFCKERYQKMKEFKDNLGIDRRCDLYDKLYTPSRVLKLKDEDKEFEQSHLQIDDEDGRSANKSKPVAFEKVQTALAIIINRNPRAAMKAYGNKYKALNMLVKSIYEHNWEENRLMIEFRKFVFHLAKYGLAYGRRYIKKTYKIKREKKGDKEVKRRVMDFCETVWETIHPKHVLLDETCDNPRNARDCFIIKDYTLQALKDKYPEEKYPKMKEVPKKSKWLKQEAETNASGKVTTAGNTDNVEEAIYENVKKDIRLIFVNGTLISGHDDSLPGEQLSIFGEKWAEKDDTYDGIGICHILENYQPLVDEISNSDIDLVREVVKPTLYKNEQLELSDEAEDDIDGQRVVTFSGGNLKDNLIFDRPTRTMDAPNMLQSLSQEMDDATGIAKDLSSLSDAKTLGQASFNRENSLRRLSLPLESIKYAIEDDANKALKLFPILNSKPQDTYVIEDEEELAEARQVLEKYPNDERFVVRKDGNIIRRKFKEIEVKIDYDKDKKKYIQTDQEMFWELIPSSYDWKGKINVIPMSFLPKSESMEQQAALQDLNIMLPIQDVDQMGQPILKDEEGKAYKINKVKLIKDYLASRSKDKEDYVYEMTDQNIAGQMDMRTMTNPANLQGTAGERQGIPQTGER